jgi:hypothetical protein
VETNAKDVNDAYDALSITPHTLEAVTNEAV